MRALFDTTILVDYLHGVPDAPRELARYSERLISQKGFSCMVDILLKLRTLEPDPIMGEVPLVLRYDLKHGMSKMRAAHTIVDTLVLMGRNLRGR